MRTIILVVACALLLGSGLAHGLWTERWQTLDSLTEACARVAEVPGQAGPWQGTAVDVDPEPYAQTKALAYWMRRYAKPGVKGTVTVILMCGRAKHMSVHTPDICYRGAGFEMVGEQKQESYGMPGFADQAGSRGPPNAECWTGRFRRPYRLGGSELHIAWAWNCGTGWEAPASPRLAFGQEPFLYKLYVAHEIPGDLEGDLVTAAFLQDFLPVLDKALFGAETMMNQTSPALKSSPRK